ncbi:MAG: hypothetical protein RL701_5663 [Pseudomonadota bacterium]
MNGHLGPLRTGANAGTIGARLQPQRINLGGFVTTTVLKDIFIARGEIDRYFEGSVPVDLWRALNRKRPGELFDFVESEFVLSNGRVRPADISIEDRSGIPWVFVRDRP